MAEVVHTIKNNQYLYEHHREGDKVVCDYIGPVGSSGGIRKAKHGGGPNRVTQQTTKRTNRGETINSKKDNNRLRQEKPEEKSTMKQFKVMEKGKQHTAEIIDASTSRDAKKAYRAKHNLDIKLSKLSSNIKLTFSQGRADEIYEKRTRKAGWTE